MVPNHLEPMIFTKLRTLENIFSFRQRIILGFSPIQTKEKFKIGGYVEFYKYNEDKRIL